MCRSHEQMLPGLQSSDDGEELPVIDFIVPLGLTQGFGTVGNRMPLAINKLGEYPPLSKVRGVYFQPERSIIDRDGEDGFRT